MKNKSEPRVLMDKCVSSVVRVGGGITEGNCFRVSARCWHTPTEGEYGVMWRRRTLPNGPYFSQGDQGRPREPALSGGGEDVSDEIASDGDRDVFREGFWADRGCSLHNARARQHSGWLADTPSSPALDAPQSEGTAVRARAGWSVLRRPWHPKIRARFDQLFFRIFQQTYFYP